MGTLVAPESILIRDDIRVLMQQAAFRRFMLRMSNSAGILVSTFGADAGLFAFSEGRRSLGLELLNTVDAAAPGARLAILSEPVSSPKEPQRDRSDDPRIDDDDDGA